MGSAVASRLGAIGKSVVQISQTHNYRRGIVVFQLFRRSAHLCGGSRRRGIGQNGESLLFNACGRRAT
jgi:hypothetical protein